ncbi:hypothetical protein HYN59_07945 [Flavobacterium album]|uniref:Uncharacterized protein n=1 Tax=Flavobacterium album TaxID=2175091 RepID=A0A2S1QXD4_9FLAO|nr:hypothetical protein [Flavobacterium album]AWH85062.1 hypothetical protein HYN59_07945 [Flavobacterium album]
MKLRRYISTLLSILILVSNIGMALNVHYCHGEVASVSLAYKIQQSCSAKPEKETRKACCGAAVKTTKSCCKHDVIKLHDTKSDNIIVKSFQLDLAAFCPAEVWNPNTLHYSEAPVAIKDTPSFYCESHAPPLFKLYCQYIFYA